jgi:putative transposase
MKGMGFAISPLCGLFGVSRQGWYDHEWRRVKVAIEEAKVIEIVRAVRGISGFKKVGVRQLYPHMVLPLLESGIKMGRDGVLDVMVRNGLCWRRRRFRPRTTFSDGYLPLYPDLAKDIVPDGPEQLWVSDITYLRVGGRWCYLSLVTDAYSHKVMGHFLAENLDAAGPVAALEMALANRMHLASKLVHHSDRGLQYRSQEYLALLRGPDAKPGDEPAIPSSMTQSGDPRENAVAERVNGILKVDMGLEDDVYHDVGQARKAVAAVIDTYNNLRTHMSIDRMVPAKAHLGSGPIRNLWKKEALK